MRVAIIAPPWLALPIKGYGGIELVIEGLIEGLLAHGVEVELFANGARKVRGIKTHSLYKTEQFDHIHDPYYDAVPIVQAHVMNALNYIRADGKFDVIHDHNTLLGPLLLSLATQMKDVPPVLHTLHGPPFVNPRSSHGAINHHKALEQIHEFARMYMVSISKAMSRQAPRSVRPHLLEPVHNAIELEKFPFVRKKKDYFITLARFTPDKGQAIAAKLAVKLKRQLRMAGTVAGIGSNRKLMFELSNPLSLYRSNQEFRYFSDKVLPYVLNHPRISYVGNLAGVRKMKFISEAKALLFPIDWEEPFGMAVIEALACGTPVVAMKRGAMPEIIKHGKTGFLANNEVEFLEYMQRVDEIDPADCRASVEECFSADAMAKAYIDRYQEVIERSRR